MVAVSNTPFFGLSNAWVANSKLHYRPLSDDGGPSWLTFLGHMKDSLWSVDLLRCESVGRNGCWWSWISTRIIGFGIRAGIVDGLALPHVQSSDSRPDRSEIFKPLTPKASISKPIVGTNTVAVYTKHQRLHKHESPCTLKNRLLIGTEMIDAARGPVRKRERIGGLRNYYYRVAVFGHYAFTECA